MSRAFRDRRRNGLQTVLIPPFECFHRHEPVAVALGAGSQFGRFEGCETSLRVLELTLEVLGVALDATNGCRQLDRQDGEEPRAFDDRSTKRAVAIERATAAQKLDTCAATKALRAGERDDPDRSRAADVRTATGRHVEVCHVDQPQLTLALGFLAERHLGHFRGIREPDRDWTILPDHTVRFGFGGRHLRRRHFAGEIDRRGGGSEVKAFGANAEEPIEGGRQDVLPGVLLHMIETARPIDAAVDLTFSQLPFNDVRDRAVVSIDDVDHPCAAEIAHVVRLPARRRIERGAIEHGHEPSLDSAGDRPGTPLDALDADHRRVELLRVRIGVVDAIGFHPSIISSWSCIVFIVCIVSIVPMPVDRSRSRPRAGSRWAQWPR
jgi:hypothetical protein